MFAALAALGDNDFCRCQEYVCDPRHCQCHKQGKACLTACACSCATDDREPVRIVRDFQGMSVRKVAELQDEIRGAAAAAVSGMLVNSAKIPTEWVDEDENADHENDDDGGGEYYDDDGNYESRRSTSSSSNNRNHAIERYQFPPQHNEPKFDGNANESEPRRQCTCGDYPCSPLTCYCKMSAAAAAVAGTANDTNAAGGAVGTGAGVGGGGGDMACSHECQCMCQDYTRLGRDFDEHALTPVNDPNVEMVVDPDFSIPEWLRHDFDDDGGFGNSSGDTQTSLKEARAMSEGEAPQHPQLPPQQPVRSGPPPTAAATAAAATVAAVASAGIVQPPLTTQWTNSETSVFVEDYTGGGGQRDSISGSNEMDVVEPNVNDQYHNAQDYIETGGGNADDDNTDGDDDNNNNNNNSNTNGKEEEEEEVEEDEEPGEHQHFSDNNVHERYSLSHPLSQTSLSGAGSTQFVVHDAFAPVSFALKAPSPMSSQSPASSPLRSLLQRSSTFTLSQPFAENASTTPTRNTSIFDIASAGAATSQPVAPTGSRFASPRPLVTSTASPFAQNQSAPALLSQPPPPPPAASSAAAAAAATAQARSTPRKPASPAAGATQAPSVRSNPASPVRPTQAPSVPRTQASLTTGAAAASAVAAVAPKPSPLRIVQALPARVSTEDHSNKRLAIGLGGFDKPASPQFELPIESSQSQSSTSPSPKRRAAPLLSGPSVPLPPRPPSNKFTTPLEIPGQAPTPLLMHANVFQGVRLGIDLAEALKSAPGRFPSVADERESTTSSAQRSSPLPAPGYLMRSPTVTISSGGKSKTLQRHSPVAATARRSPTATTTTTTTTTPTSRRSSSPRTSQPSSLPVLSGKLKRNSPLKQSTTPIVVVDLVSPSRESYADDDDENGKEEEYSVEELEEEEQEEEEEDVQMHEEDDAEGHDDNGVYEEGGDDIRIKLDQLDLSSNLDRLETQEERTVLLTMRKRVREILRMMCSIKGETCEIYWEGAHVRDGDGELRTTDEKPKFRPDAKAVRHYIAHMLYLVTRRQILESSRFTARAMKEAVKVPQPRTFELVPKSITRRDPRTRQTKLWGKFFYPAATTVSGIAAHYHMGVYKPYREKYQEEAWGTVAQWITLETRLYCKRVFPTNRNRDDDDDDDHDNDDDANEEEEDDDGDTDDDKH